MLRAELQAQLGDVALDVALEVPAGACLALCGPSGAGKTSALRAIAGLRRPDAGRVACGEEVWLDVAAGVDRPPEARRVGVVFQEHALFAHLSAWRNVAYPLRHLPRRERRARALELLDRLGLAARADARPATLSGGERQRVALARALAREPQALLLDEPLSALDPRTRAGAARELAAVLRDSGVPALLVSHDWPEAATLADRVAVLDGGRVVQAGAPAEVAARPATAAVADLTGAVVLLGVADGTAVALDGGGTLALAEARHGPVAVVLRPWDVAVEPAGSASSGSPRTRLDARVVTVTDLGGRVRVALDAGQPLLAEVTGAAAAELGLVPGLPVVATVKATAVRVVERG